MPIFGVTNELHVYFFLGTAHMSWKKKIGNRPTLLDKTLHVTHMRHTVYSAGVVCLWPRNIGSNQVLLVPAGIRSHLVNLQSVCCGLCRCIWCYLAVKAPSIYMILTAGWIFHLVFITDESIQIKPLAKSIHDCGILVCFIFVLFPPLLLCFPHLSSVSPTCPLFAPLVIDTD